MPVLGDGEFYFAEDRAQLYVGFFGGNLKVGNMAVPIQDSAGNNLTSTSGALDVNVKSNTDTPIPVSAVSLPLPAGASTDTSLTNGAAKSQIVNGSGSVVDVQPRGTQGSLFLCVQEAKDSGRTYVVITIDRIAGVTTEALATFTINRGGTVTTGTSYTVTAGKVLRLQSFVATILDSTTTTVNGRVRVRSAGTVSVTSGVILASDCGDMTGTAVAGSGEAVPVQIPDGLEIAAGQQIGISQVVSSTSSTVSVCLIGFEY